MKKGSFRLVVPTVVFLTAVSYVYTWDRMTTEFAKSFKGAAGEGRLAECLLELVRTPYICFVVLATVLLLTVGFVSAVDGMRKKHRGAIAMFILMIFASAVYAVLTVSLVSGLTA